MFPSYHVAVIGETVRITCDSFKNVSWRFSGGAMPHNVHAKSSPSQNPWISIEHVEQQNGGTYTCIEEDDNVVYEAEAVVVVTSKSQNC